MKQRRPPRRDKQQLLGQIAACHSVLREIIELYPQTYACDHGERHKVHIEVTDWQEIKARIDSLILGKENT